MTSLDPDFAARMAHAADVADGLAQPAEWDELDQSERNSYRRAVQGLGNQGGVALIERERWRQISAAGFTGVHDDRYTDSELVAAALCYATLAIMQQTRLDAAEMLAGFPPIAGYGWPPGWDWRPEPTSYANLVKAGALIAAELDRLSRLEEVPQW